jgi:hypothetical protein
MPHFLDPRRRRLRAEQLPRPCASFRVGALLREPFLDHGPLTHCRVACAVGPCLCKEDCQRHECECELSQHGNPDPVVRACPAFVSYQWHCSVQPACSFLRPFLIPCSGIWLEQPEQSVCYRLCHPIIRSNLGRRGTTKPKTAEIKTRWNWPEWAESGALNCC